MSIYTKPSFWANSLQGLLIFVLLMMMCMWWKDIKSKYERIIILSLLALVIGVHGLLHLGLEKTYDWNPMEGKWI